ncbi:MAG: ATP synthase complex assembly protein atp12 [Alyxoria varia]|nr:MAG: ATP synthase complex assembly protein atp12 [Alyxoria varia]
MNRAVRSSISCSAKEALARHSQSCRRRELHWTTSNAATPLPLPTQPGPPPKPPLPSASFQGEQVARKKGQAELRELGKQLKANPAKPSTALRKRFWKNVSVKNTSEGYQIMLDTRPVRTSSKRILTIPHEKHDLAVAVAIEWDHLVTAQQALKQQYVPLTSLTSRALDIAEADAKNDSSVRDSAVQLILGYLNTDTLLCWAPEKDAQSDTVQRIEASGPQTSSPPTSLRDIQIRTAQPILSFLTTYIWPGVDIHPSLSDNSIFPSPQPEMTIHVIRGWVSGLPAYELAALERGVLASKSICVATRILVEWSQEYADLRANWGSNSESYQPFSIEDAAEACNLEVSWQTRMWGEVEDTHDVDFQDLRRQLGSAVLLVHSGG